MKRCSFLCKCILLLTCGAFFIDVFAARPFVTDDAGVVEQGKFELETACDYWKDDATESINLKHGLTKKLDLEVGVGYIPAPQEERTFTPVNILLKYSFIPDLLSMTMSADWGLSTYNANAILSKCFGPVEFDVNLGYQTHDNMKRADCTYGVAASYEFKRLRIGVETDGTDKDADWWQGGAQFTITDWMKIDAGIGGDFDKNTSYTATTGLWFTFPFDKRN